jgi:hypothetical protein
MWHGVQRAGGREERECEDRCLPAGRHVVVRDKAATAMSGEALVIGLILGLRSYLAAAQKRMRVPAALM